MRKKIILGSTSLLSIVTPITTAISCGIDKEPTKEQLEAYRDLTSDVALRILENQWQYKIIGWDRGENLNQDFKYITDVPITNDVLTLAKRMISNGIRGSESYLKTFGSTLLSSNAKRPYDETIDNIYNQKWLAENGLLKTYLFGEVTFGEDGLTDDAIRLLISDDRIDFKTNLLKTLVSKEYLTTDKSQWSLVYPIQATRLTRTETLIDPAIFVLVQQLIEKKYFASWEISLNENDSNSFVGKEGTFKDSYAALTYVNGDDTKQGEFAIKAKYGERNARIKESGFDFSLFSNNNLGYDLIGFTGFSNQSTSVDILQFTKEKFEDAVNYDKWSGFLTKDFFIDKDRKTILDEEDDSKPEADKDFMTFPWRDEGQTAKLTYMKGIMPIYVNVASADEDEDKRLTIKYLADENSNISESEIQKRTNDQIQAIADFLTINDSSLYNEAVNFFLTRVDSNNPAKRKAPILLEILHDEYRKVLEGLNVQFITERKPESDE